MNAYTNADLKMPAHYTDMSEKEMEYDGGWLHLFGAVMTVVGFACTAASHSGIIKDENTRNIVKAVGITSSIVGVGLLTCGLASAATSATFGAADGASLVADICTVTFDLCSYLA